MNDELKALLERYGVDDTRQLVQLGDTVKALGNNKFAGRAVRWGSPGDVDLIGDYFHAKTYYGEVEGNTYPIYYQHGFDGTLKNLQIGTAKLNIDEEGLWLEGQLEIREEYLSRNEAEEAQKWLRPIYKLLDGGVLGLSTGALSHLASGRFMGKSFQWDQWIIGEISLTPNPAEPRAEADPVKNAHALATYAEIRNRPTFKSLIGDTQKTEVKIDGEQVAKAIDVNINISTPEKDQTKTMNEAQNTEAVDKKETDLSAKLDTLIEVVSESNGRVKALEAAEAARVAAAGDDALKAGVNAGGGSNFATNAAAIITHGIPHHKYDNYSICELAMCADFLDAGFGVTAKNRAPSQGLYAHLASRLMASDGELDRYKFAKNEFLEFARLNGLTLKANELMQSTLAAGGDEWIGVAYSSEIWDEIRDSQFVLPTLKQIEFPAGAESMTIGKKTGSVTFYTIAQASAQSANPGDTTHTVTTSKMTTGQVSLSLAKVGAGSTITGELSEDSFLPVVSVLRDDFIEEGREVLDSMVLDGDTAAGASANINDIAGTPGGTEFFMAFNGMRKSCLVTTTANSRDGGVLDENDFLETAALMGDAGKEGADITKVQFVIDPATHRKAVQLPVFKTRDVNGQATIENGRLTNVYGYPVATSYNMHRGSTDRKANAAGKVDLDTTANNAKGAILAYRGDRWMFGWRRRGTIEAQRVPRADATEFTYILRCGLVQRDTEGSAITYNVTV